MTETVGSFSIIFFKYFLDLFDFDLKIKKKIAPEVFIILVPYGKVCSFQCAVCEKINAIILQGSWNES